MSLRSIFGKLSTFFLSSTLSFHFCCLLPVFLRLDAIKPLQYLENKAVLNEALERLNWPISLKELSVLENEILVGKMYIQQAMELQEAARKNCTNKALEEVGPRVLCTPPSLLSPLLSLPGPPLSPTHHILIL